MSVPSVHPLKLPPVVLADAGTTVLIVVGITILIGISIFFTHRADRKRRGLLREWAAARDFGFDPERNTRLHKKHSDFGLFKQGSGRAALNTARFTIEALDRTLPARLGDYTYTIAAGNSAVVHKLSYLMITLPFEDLPATGLRPEDVSDRINAALGFDDIDFEDAEFSRRFYVSSKDKRFAYDLLSPRMIEHLKSTPHPATIEIVGRHLLLRHGHSKLHKTDTRWSPDQCDERIDFARALLDRWPDHMLAELENDSSFRTGVET